VALQDLHVEVEPLRDICRRYGIAELHVFGSVARGDATASSDLDLLYVLAPGRHLGWEIEQLTDELAELFGRPVDLVSKRSLHPMMRDAVLADAAQLHTV
jgi:hypothetical protein